MKARKRTAGESQRLTLPLFISVVCWSMFHLFSYCWSWLQAIQEPMRKVTILVLGLDSAGKSSLVKEIQRVLSCEVLPITKPNQTALRVDRFEVSLIDLPGGQQSLGSWRDQYSTAHGIIFVLDSSDVARMEEAKKTLSRVLGHPKVSGKPLLLLANKQDKLDALLPCEIIECLSLEKLVNENKSLCRIEPCSASKRLPKIQCWTIVQGLHWLLRTIATNYSVLCGRIQEDSPEQQVSLEQEVSKKVQKSRNRTSEARESLARRECSQGGNAKMEEKKPTKLPQNIPSQEEMPVASKKKKGKLKLKVKKKGLVQSENTLTEDDSAKAAGSGSKVGGVTVCRPSNKVAQENPRVLETAAPPAGQSTKKKNKRLKNKVKSQESSQTQPNEHLSSTFDLYRRAMLALKMQPQGRKPQSTTTP
ncbi:ADP-ribosylation factor-like protein 13A isoform X2 [Podarcis raffonei]|uniref:ADP-ribosylation factor-like protein 13A isoform X2 n=1 Tax=Podarcis raffonei TaxID=65483 RepID=UPI00232962C7|nr:ADP-ribosylation factor-like protein 13A isoform X2 [Podarcis raffonei]